MTSGLKARMGKDPEARLGKSAQRCRTRRMAVGLAFLCIFFATDYTLCFVPASSFSLIPTHSGSVLRFNQTPSALLHSIHYSRFFSQYPAQDISMTMTTKGHQAPWKIQTLIQAMTGTWMLRIVPSFQARLE
jgi:hypothetical protein